tara:strand:- start:1003 stop:1527 length:525 start_codon:yes stop_codon:yes gene_type:complete
MDVINDYKNLISTIDIDRSVDSLEHMNFEGMFDVRIDEFLTDIETNNDAIELHLIKNKSYKEMVVFNLRRSKNGNSMMWKELLKDEQKTFGGSKIFYMNTDCTKLLVLLVPNEMANKVGMVITRINKINDKIVRMNTKIKKDNKSVYTTKLKIKESETKTKDEIINMVNLNLKV